MLSGPSTRISNGRGRVAVSLRRAAGRSCRATMWLLAASLVALWISDISRFESGGVSAALLEQSPVPPVIPAAARSFAVYATGTTCGAISMSGGGIVDSFDSSQGPYAETRTQGQARVGVTGNISLSGSKSIVYGRIFALNTNVGSCKNGVPGITLTGGAVVTEGFVRLPSAPVFPAPANVTPGSKDINAGTNLALAPGNYGRIAISGGATLTLAAGTYNINSLSLSGGSVLATAPSGQVIVNVAGVKVSQPVNMSGGTLHNQSGIPLNFQLIYGGSQSIVLSGGTMAYGVIYAPNAGVKLSGGGGWFGAMTVKTLDDSGGSPLHYDRALIVPPTITSTVTPAPNANGWHKTTVAVSFTCSGPLGIASCPSPVTVTNEGQGQIVSGTVTDIAGNTATTSVSLNIDKTPPVVTAAASPAANGSGWNRTPVSIHFTCADSGSGIATCGPDAVLSTEGTKQTATGTATDLAGNTASVTSGAVNIDLTSPVVAVTSPPNGSVVSVSPATLAGTVSDALSGVSSVACNGQAGTVSGGTFQCAVPLTQGANSISALATDVAGNTNTAPWALTFTPTDGQLTLTITEPANGAIVAYSPVTVRGTVSDPNARVVVQNVLATVSGTTFEAPAVPLFEGLNQLLARARDDEGDQATATRSITLDTIAPVVNIGSPPEREVLTSSTISIAGTVTDASAVTCTVGGSSASVATGSFSANATLSAGPNVVTVTCQDAAGNVSTRSRTLYFSDSRLSISDLGPFNGATGVSPTSPIVVTFSRPVDPSSVSTATVLITAGGAVLPATLSVSADGLVVTATPLVPWPQGTSITIVVTSGVVGADGTPLPSPFASQFTTSGTATAPTVFAGEAYDDSRGQPLPGASAQAIDPATGEVLASAESDERGRFLLNAGRPGVVVRVSKAGFASVIRGDATPHGAFANIFDARLTPLAAPQAVNALFGGSVQNSTGDGLSILPGALPADASIVFTPISEQGPRQLFPQGWSPLSVVDIVGPGAFQSPVTLSLVDRSQAAAGRAAIVARFDDASFKWIAIQGATIPSTGRVQVGDISSVGQYALLVPDQGDGAPPAPEFGQPLGAATASAIPLTATGAGSVTPATGRADDPTHAAAVVTVIAGTPLRSGTPLRGDFMELFVSRGGQPIAPLDTSQDFIGYRAVADPNGTSLASHFPIAASRTFSATELSEGTITVTMFRSTLSSKSLVGSSGGGVESSDGSRVIAPAGAFASDVPLQLRRVDTSGLQLNPPAGTGLLGVLDLDLSGQTSAAPLTLSLGGGASLAPTGSQAIVAELRNVRGVERLVFVTLARIDGTALTTISTIDGVTVAGVRTGGRYAFLRFDGALAIVNGTARDTTGRRDGHITELEAFPFVSITGATGAFVLPSPAGAFALLATSAVTSDRVRVAGTTGVALSEIVIGLVPPRVESIVVRPPRIEGNFAGPVVLLGKPASIVDDDTNGQSQGNGNGQVNAGERIELTLSVRNDGTVPVTGGSFVLAIRGPTGSVAVLPASIPVSSLEPDVPTAVGPFVFDVPAGIDPSLLQYTVSFLTSAGLSNAIPFRLPFGVDHWNVSIGSEITIRFSEPVAVPDGALSLQREDGGSLVPVETRVFADEGGDVIVVRPLVALTQEAVYRITLTGGIVDVDGRSLGAAPVIERFRTEDRTPPAPIGAGKISASVPDAEGFVTISATPGSVNPDDVVILLNETTGFTVLVPPAADGSFTGRVRAEISDQIMILLRDRNGNETRVDPGPLLRRDPVTGAVIATVIGRSGGTVTSADGIRLIVPAGALPGATELSVVRVPEPFTLPPDLDAGVAAAFQARFTVIDRVRIDADISSFTGPIRLVLPAPPGAGPGDQFVVARRRSVTIGGALADLDTISGIPLTENPRRVVERLEILDSASVKTLDGEVVLSTDSPPFDGITEPDVLTVIRVAGPLTFVTGEVRRDSTTGATVANAVVQSLPGALATAPFAAITNDRGVFVVADGSIPGLLLAGAVVSTRLDVTDPDFPRVIRRDVRATVQPSTPPNTTVALLDEPFVLPTRLPDSFTLILGDVEPPVVTIDISGPSFANGFTRIGDPLTVRVTAQDNDVVTVVGLELDQGTGFETVQLTPDGSFALMPSAPAVLTFRARARDRQSNETFVTRRVRAAAPRSGGGFVLDPVPAPPAIVDEDLIIVDYLDPLDIPFTEPLNPQTVSTNTVALRDPEGQPVEIDVTLEGGGTIVRATPRGYLRLGACYSLLLSSSIRDLAGQDFAGLTLAITTPRPAQVTILQPPNTTDVELAGDLLVAVSEAPVTPEGHGALHTFRVRDQAGDVMRVPQRLTPVNGIRTFGRPLSLAAKGGRAYVGNRWLGPIATRQPLFSVFIPGVTTLPDSILTCNDELVRARATSSAAIVSDLQLLCEGMSSVWASLPNPPSNIETFSLANPNLPVRTGGRAFNYLRMRDFTGAEVWNPNTWPDRIVPTSQGLAVLNFLDNLEFFSEAPQPVSGGVLGRIKRYGETTSQTEFFDAAVVGRFAVTLERDGIRVRSTQGIGDGTERNGMVPVAPPVLLPGTAGGRIGAVPGFEWNDRVQNRRRISDLVFVATRDRVLSIVDISNATAPEILGTLPETFGNMSFDACRGVAFLHDFNGGFHVVDFTNPRTPRELNRPGQGQQPFRIENLGARVTHNGNATDGAMVYVAGDAGIAVIQVRTIFTAARGCGQGQPLQTADGRPAGADRRHLGGFTFAEPLQNGSAGRPVDRVQTDGAAIVRVELQLNNRDWSALRASPTADVEITIREPGRDGTCRAGDLFADRASAAAAGSTVVSTSIVRPVDLTRGVAVAYYRTTDSFRCTVDDAANATRLIEFRARILNAQSDGGRCAGGSLHLVRPAVLLVHGYNSNAGMWNQFPLVSQNSSVTPPGPSVAGSDRLVGPFFSSAVIRYNGRDVDIPPLAFFAADYEPAKQSSYDAGLSLLRPQVPELFDRLANARIAAARFDVVAHSMGAPLTRLLDNDTGVVRRFISLDGVHIGSMLADCVHASAAHPFIFDGCNTAVPFAQVLRDFADQMPAGLTEMSFDLAAGAVGDMLTTSNRPLPVMSRSHVHAFVGSLDHDPQARDLIDAVYNNGFQAVARGFAAGLAGTACGVALRPDTTPLVEPPLVTNFSFDLIFGPSRGGPSHDIAVSAYSQSGALTGEHCSLFGGNAAPASVPLSCHRETLEAEANDVPVLSQIPIVFRNLGVKHLKGPIPGRAIYESQAVALKVAELLDMRDPEIDLDLTTSNFTAGRFAVGFPPVFDRENRGCSAVHVSPNPVLLAAGGGPSQVVAMSIQPGGTWSGAWQLGSPAIASVAPGTDTDNRSTASVTGIASGTSPLVSKVYALPEPITIPPGRANVRVIDVSQPGEIWNFCGEQPPGFDFLTTLTASDGPGEYVWEVSAGFENGGLVEGSQIVQRLTSTQQRTVQVRANPHDPTPGGDVEVRLTYVEGRSSVSIQRALTVLAPRTLLKTDLPNLAANAANSGVDGCQGVSECQGFVLQTNFDLFDSRSPAQEITASVPVNEFLHPTQTLLAGATWAHGPPKGFISTGGFGDANSQFGCTANPLICVVLGIAPLTDMAPAPLPPQSPLNNTPVIEFVQDFFVGSVEPGHGCRVATNTVRKFIDHAERIDFRSPFPD